MAENTQSAGQQGGSSIRTGLKVIRELAVTAVIAGLVFLVVQTSFQNFQVEGSSMESTLRHGQLVLVNKVLYKEYGVGGWGKFVPFLDRDKDGLVRPFHEPRRGEVVVFLFPGDLERKFIKRIVGLPGDTVEIRQGLVYVNGELVPEQYVEMRGRFNLSETQVPAGHFWVMGDNRIASSDSREWGFLPRENVIGKAWMTYWPLNRWGSVSSYAS